MGLFAPASSPEISAKFATEVVRQKVKNSDECSSALLASSTGGKPLQVFTSPHSEPSAKTKRQLFSAEDIYTFQQVTILPHESYLTQSPTL